MPEFPMTDSIITSLNAQEPWPDNVKLFQPYEVEQILLPDNASCLAVQAFLKMCNLPFEVEMRWNAEFMSPSGRVPFIKCGAFVVSELEPIVQFAANKGVTLCGKLSTEEKAEMRAYMSLITNVLVNAELYISWIDDETYNAVTKVRNSSVYPWPLGWLQTRAKRSAVAKRLRALHWGDKTLDQVLADVEQCCNSLSQRLGDRDYFFGNTPTPLDALVCGHIRGLLSAKGPKAALMIKPMTSSLLKHVVRMISATGMSLTPQEEYLLSQAFQVSRRRLSPERTISERSTRIKRSRLCTRNPSRESVTYNRDMFGFKPFASKQMTIMASKEGGVTVTVKQDDAPKHSTTTFKMEDNYNFTMEIIEDILDKVDELAFDHVNVIPDEKHDFEMVYTNKHKYDLDTMKITEFLDTIEENDIIDTSTSLELSDDLVQIINDNNDENDDTDDNNDVINNDIMDSDGIENDDVINDNNIMDSDGVVNDKHLEQAVLNEGNESYFTDSSNNKTMKESYLAVNSSGDRISKVSDKSDVPRTPFSSGSKSTLKLPSDEEISVESLLKYLRERNAAYGHIGNYIQAADID